MNKKIKYYEIDYKELDNYSGILDGQLSVYNQHGWERLLKLFFGSFIFFVCFFIIFLMLDYIFKPTDMQKENITGFLIIGIPLILYIVFKIYQHVNIKNNKGRTIINIPISTTQNNIEQKLNDILLYFKYKEKNYHGEKVYFAKRQVIFQEYFKESTYYRYIKYTIKNNTLQIEAWIKNELPIDSKFWGRKIKMILLYELQEIKKYISN